MIFMHKISGLIIEIVIRIAGDGYIPAIGCEQGAIEINDVRAFTEEFEFIGLI